VHPSPWSLCTISIKKGAEQGIDHVGKSWFVM